MKDHEDRSAHMSVELRERTDDMIADALARGGIVPEAGELDTLHAVRDYAAAHDLSSRDIAARMRCSNSVVTLVFNGKYAAGIGSFCARARAWLDREAKTATYGGRRDFVQTGLARDLMVVFEKTRYNRRIQPMQSPEQLGKSTAAREYVRRNPGHAVLVTLQPEGLSNGFMLFLRTLADRLGFPPENVKTCDLRSQIDKHLAGIELVILDEFHLAATWKPSQLRSLLDYIRVTIQADGERGVVLIATVPDNAEADTSVMRILNDVRAKTRYNLGQLYGRMTSSVLDLSSGDIAASDVAGLVQRYYAPGKACLEQLCRAAQRDGFGHLGLIDGVLCDAASEAAVDRTPITDALVLRVLNAKLEDIRIREQSGSRR
ncbi:MAG: hypothetical protein PHR35_04145 [Kiritimatiellae bacterium]|nr:hypothetical protein [Kiritimatiellia bacterium]